ncbi:MAG: hypothetical protein HRU19_04735 [Pseudobacteriovorax sp.]|nr:hypothetical protein [Pseudobacteriovorax sp.]
MKKNKDNLKIVESSEQISVRQKAINSSGKELLLNLITMDGDEGLLSNEACQAFGISPSGLRSHMQRHEICSSLIETVKLKSLKKQGIVSNKTNQTTFIPKEGLRQLVKLINSPEAWSIYNQMWELIDHVHVQDAKPKGLDTDEIQRVIEATVKELFKNNEAELKKLRNYEGFPHDCLRVADITRIFFPGISKSRVSEYLTQINHPRGYFRRYDEHGSGDVEPYKIIGLETAAKKFFRDLVTTSETDSNWICVHPSLEGRVFISKARRLKPA